ncbi:CheR family methyltransferase [Tundrisphaera sp. TA3]|uniref:CheR family methyltransferase n=1 Tax=Tundrisphaera sp. TA3 TaxID=3435775 RepID=UPI003EBB6BDA
MADEELTDPEFERFRALIYKVAGIRVSASKKFLVTNRLRRRLKATGIPTFGAYYARLVSAQAESEMPAFLDAITTNETYFYRDIHHYEWLGGTFLPEFARMDRSRSRRLRIWSAACATGEEPYSIALKVAANRAALAGREVTILGTDLSGAALEAARAGSYDDRAVHLVPAEERDRAFERDPIKHRWSLRPEIRRMVSWKLHNLLRPIVAEPFDCIFIKNVLIYFDAESKQAVVRNLLASLAKGGYLVVGPTEGIFGMLGPLAKQKTWLYQNPR